MISLHDNSKFILDCNEDEYALRNERYNALAIVPLPSGRLGLVGFSNEPYAIVDTIVEASAAWLQCVAEKARKVKPNLQSLLDQIEP